MHILDAMSGIIQIFGEKDSGKTSLGFQAMLDPKKSAFIDGDEKGREMIEGYKRAGIDFAHYRDLTLLWQGHDNATRKQILMDTVRNIPSGLDVILWDNWKPVYDTMRVYISTHQREFGDSNYWRGDSKIIQGLISKAARMQEEDILLTLRNKAKLVIVVSHLADQWMGAAKTGAQIPDSSEVFERICYARFWLRHNPNSPVPIALVVKRPNKAHFIPGVGPRPINVLPPKVTPTSDDQSVWDTVMRYWETPLGNRPLLPEETPTMEEAAMMRGVLTPMQREAWLVSIKATLAEEKIETALPLPPVEEKIAELKEQGITALPAVMAALKEFGYKVSPPEVVKLLKGV